MATIADIRARVAARVHDSAKSLDPAGVTTSIDVAIGSARAEFEKARPLVASQVVTGTGTHKYSLTDSSPILTGFVDGLSVIRSIVCPYDATSQNIEPLEEEDWKLVRLAGGIYLWFTYLVPTASQSMLIEFTKAHTCDKSTLTVLAADYEAMADLAASHALLILANNYVQSIDGSITADAVNRQSKASEYRSMAAAYRKAYELKMASGQATGGVSIIADADRSDSAGRDYLFHGRRSR